MGGIATRCYTVLLRRGQYMSFLPDRALMADQRTDLGTVYRSIVDSKKKILPNR